LFATTRAILSGAALDVEGNGLSLMSQQLALNNLVSSLFDSLVIAASKLLSDAA
jgi:hypothetical protein